MMHISCWRTEGCSADNCTFHSDLKHRFLVISELIYRFLFSFFIYLYLLGVGGGGVKHNGIGHQVSSEM